VLRLCDGIPLAVGERFDYRFRPEMQAGILPGMVRCVSTLGSSKGSTYSLRVEKRCDLYNTATACGVLLVVAFAASFVLGVKQLRYSIRWQREKNLVGAGSGV
jgi:hypothetical protein